MTQIKITPPPIEQKYINHYEIIHVMPGAINRSFEALTKAYLYAGAVGLDKYGKPPENEKGEIIYSRWHWFSKAFRHLVKYWIGSRYDSEGQHHLAAALFAMVMLLAKTEGGERWNH